MGSVAIKAEKSVTLSYNVKVSPIGGAASHQLISFFGMHGAEVKGGITMPESYNVSAWIAGAKLTTVNSLVIEFCEQFRKLLGKTSHTLTVVNDDGSTYSVTNIVGVGQPQCGQALQISGGWARPISFSIQKVR